MPTFKLLLITPDTTLYEGDVISAIFPGTEGQFEILKDHAAFLTQTKRGEVFIVDANKERKIIPILTGFFEFRDNKATLLTFREQFF